MGFSSSGFSVVYFVDLNNNHFIFVWIHNQTMVSLRLLSYTLLRPEKVTVGYLWSPWWNWSSDIHCWDGSWIQLSLEYKRVVHVNQSEGGWQHGESIARTSRSSIRYVGQNRIIPLFVLYEVRVLHKVSSYVHDLSWRSEFLLNVSIISCIGTLMESDTTSKLTSRCHTWILSFSINALKWLAFFTWDFFPS